MKKQFDPDYQPTKQVQEELGLIPFAKSKGKEENKRTKQTKERKQKKPKKPANTPTHPTLSVTVKN